MPSTPLFQRQNPSSVVVIGPGHWGTALAKTLQSSERKDSIKISYIKRDASQADWKKAFETESPPLVVTALPFRALEVILKKLSRQRLYGVVNASKGIDRKTLLTFSQLAEKYLNAPYATLSGPTFAKELALKKPTACVIAGHDKKFVRRMSQFFSTSFFRAYTSSDPVGVEVCGAMKNVLAIACGISDGLQLGQNARAALLTRGLREILTVATCLGGKPATVFGLAGVGDLWLTATGDLSRNRQFGMLLAKGYSCEEALSRLDGPSEGYYTVKQTHALAKKHGLDLPIAEQVYKIISGKQSAEKALHSLMTRDLKSEESTF